MKTVKKESREKELSIQKQINDNLDNKKSFVFDAIAGSGKTYSLVESINHVISTQNKKLKRMNQKILVITYTNAAKDEIINRIGDSYTLEIGTIHEIFWGFISRYNAEMIEIHKKYVIENINTLSTELGSEEFDFKNIIKILGYPDNMDDYFNKTELKAAEFKSYLKSFNSIDDKFYSNVANFKSKIGKVRNLLRLESINYGEFKQVKYNGIMSINKTI